MNIQALSTASVTGFLHEPANSARDAIVLTHGAGANCQSPLLREVAASLSCLGFAALRCDLPFRQKRKFGPPSPAAAALDREGLWAAVLEMRSRVPGSVYLGDHSYGGRQASMLAAEDGRDIPDLLLLSYPLHPPRRPTELRTAHFEQLTTPCFFAHGASDPFGSPEEMENSLKRLKARHQLLTIDGVGHDLGRGNREVTARVATEFKRFVER